MILARRGFLTGLVGLIAAPAVVKAENLMKIVVPPPLSITQKPELYVPNLGTNQFREIVEPILNEVFNATYRYAPGWTEIFRLEGA